MTKEEKYYKKIVRRIDGHLMAIENLVVSAETGQDANAIIADLKMKAVEIAHRMVLADEKNEREKELYNREFFKVEEDKER